MAVEKKYAIDELETGYPQSNFKKEGQKLTSVVSRVTIATADTDASVYGLAVIPGEACIKDIKLATTAITAGTDYDIGLYRYKADGTIGAVIDKDMFLDGQTMAAARARGAEITGISALATASSDLTVAALAAAVSSLTEVDPLYVLAITANTVGSTDGTIVVFIDYVSNV